MPTIPTEFYQTVMPQGQLTEQNIQAAPQEFGSQIGATIEKTGEELQQHAIQRQQLVNETTVNDLYANSFAPAFRHLYNNFYQLQGKDPELQFTDYQKQMTDLRGRFKEQLNGPIQQKMFDEITRQRMNFELDGMARHAAQQTQVYHQETSNSLLSQFANDGIEKYNDPQTLRNRENSILVETSAYGRQAGQSPEEADKRARHYIDQMYRGAIERATTSDPAAALQMYRQYQNKLSGDMQREMEKYLHPFQETIQAQRAFCTATGGPTASRITSETGAQGVDPAMALTVWSCEGSVTNPTVKNPDSQATGHFQFLPGTWADMGGTEGDRLDSNRQIELGVKFIAQNSKQLESDLGRRPQAWEVYLAHQQGIEGAEKLLHADPDANAGQIVGNPKAITLNGGTADMSAGRFLTMIQGYVDRHSRMYDIQGLPTAQNIRENYQSGLEAVRQLARQEHPGDPAAEDRYTAYYTQHAGQLLHAEQMSDRANMDMIDSGINGPNGAKSWAEFQADPNRARAYSAVFSKDPSIRDRVDKAISMNALNMWDPAPSSETDAIYKDLKGMQFGANRERFSNMDLNQYYGAMPIAQFNELQREQQAIRRSDAATAEKHVSLQQAVKLLEPAFNEAKAAPGSQYFGADAHSAFGDSASKYNQYLGNLSNAIDIWRRNNNGKVPSDADLLKIGREMLMPEAPTRAGETEASRSAESPTAKYEAYLRQNGYPVTPANITALQDRDAARAEK
jgi:hypothetical protein